MHVAALIRPPLAHQNPRKAALRPGVIVGRDKLDAAETRAFCEPQRKSRSSIGSRDWRARRQHWRRRPVDAIRPIKNRRMG